MHLMFIYVKVFLQDKARSYGFHARICVCVVGGLILHLLGGEAWSSQGHAVASLPVLLSCSRSVPHTILLVHHLLKQRLVICVQRRYWNVPHRSELTAVIQVFVLQAEEVPDKAPETYDRLWGWVTSLFSYFSYIMICNSSKRSTINHR